MANSYSVSFRLQRVTTESAHISVLVTNDLWLPKGDDSGTATLDVEKLVQVALAQGQLESTVWNAEHKPLITLHPLQTTPDHATESGGTRNK
jgi:hypothetical protein